MLDENVSVSNKTSTNNFKSQTNRELKMMTKKKAFNMYKSVYQETDQHLRSRLENVNVDDIQSYKREEILAFTKTLVEKTDSLPDNVTEYLNKAKIRRLKKLATDTKIIEMTRKYKREELLEIHKMTYSSRPYLYLKQDAFRVLATKYKEKGVKAILYATPIVQYGYEKDKKEEKKEDKQEDNEENKINNLAERKKTNLTKYQAINMCFIENKPIKEIVKVLGISYVITQKWINKFDRYGDVNHKVKRKGRKKVINEEMKEFIQEEYNYEPALETKELVKNINDKFEKKIHKQTVYKFLKRIGKFVKPKEKGVLNLLHKKKRLLY
jgi:transposase